MTKTKVAKSNGTLTYFAAQLQILRANPELAEAYRMQPGVKER